MKTYFVKDIVNMLSTSKIKKMLEHEKFMHDVCSSDDINFLGFIGECIGNRTRTALLCKCGHYWEPIVSSIKQGSRCPKCAKQKSKKREYITKEQQEKQIIEICKSEKLKYRGVVGEWTSNKLKTKIMIECLDGHIYTPTVTHFTKKGTRCPQCHTKNIQETNKKSTYYKSEILKRCSAINYKIITLLDNDITHDTKLTIQCTGGHAYTTDVTSFLRGYNCRICAYKNNSSLRIKPLEHYEKIIYSICKSENIKYNGIIDEYNGSSTRISMLCGCGSVWTPTIHSITRTHKRCPSCTKSGYKRLKQGTLYIQKLLRRDVFEGVKFGITNLTTRERMRNQSAKSKFDHEIFYELTLQDGQKILELENKIKEAMKGKTSYISKEDMPDGYTETVAPSELSTIMYIVKSFEKELTA